jgi:hypothetical protein
MGNAMITGLYHRIGDYLVYYIGALVLGFVMVVAAVLMGATWWEGFYLWGMVIVVVVVLVFFAKHPYAFS